MDPGGDWLIPDLTLHTYNEKKFNIFLIIIDEIFDPDVGEPNPDQKLCISGQSTTLLLMIASQTPYRCQT